MEFHRFRNLPAELRCRIWRFALEGSRLHRVSLEYDDHEEQPYFYSTETLEGSTLTPRAILSVSQESRREALRALPDSLPLADGPVLRFDRSKDVICLCELDYRRTVEFVGIHWLEDFHSGRKPEELGILSNIKTLAVEAREVGFTNNLLGKADDELEGMVTFFAAFANLEELFLVTRPCADDPTTLVYGAPGQGEFMGPGLDSVTGICISRDTKIPHKEFQPRWSDWVCGEVGLSDWYRHVPQRGSWKYSNEAVKWHLEDMNRKAWYLQMQLELFNRDMDVEVFKSVRVKVMAHFRQGAGPIVRYY